jgi:hypothetical protein
MELWHTKYCITRASIINKQTYPTIHKETKFTTSKSTKYLQRLFPQYKMIFNNTTTTTQTRRIQGQPYNNPKRGLLILIHQQIPRKCHQNPPHHQHLPISTNN